MDCCVMFYTLSLTDSLRPGNEPCLWFTHTWFFMWDACRCASAFMNIIKWLITVIVVLHICYIILYLSNLHHCNTLYCVIHCLVCLEPKSKSVTVILMLCYQQTVDYIPAPISIGAMNCRFSVVQLPQAT